MAAPAWVVVVLVWWTLATLPLLVVGAVSTVRTVRTIIAAGRDVVGR